MAFDVTARVLDPATDLDDPDREFPRLEGVVYASVEASRRRSFYGYDSMVEAAHGRLLPHLSRLADAGFSPHVFLVGAALDAEEVRSIPHYDLWNKARKLGLISRGKVTRDLFHEGRRRRIALHAIDAADTLAACRYQAWANRCVIVLSREPNFLSMATLDRLYGWSRPEEARRFAEMNWAPFVAPLCGAGHALLQEHGSFDDLHQRVDLCVPKAVWDATR